MNILFLGYGRQSTSIIDAVVAVGHNAVHTSEKLSADIFSTAWDIVISFGYRHIIKKEEFIKLAAPVINLHISHLPKNRGAHPNFWAHYEAFCSKHFMPNGKNYHSIITPPPPVS
jgi:methionyl-tRNA formyltransferase